MNKCISVKQSNTLSKTTCVSKAFIVNRPPFRTPTSAFITVTHLKRPPVFKGLMLVIRNTSSEYLHTTNYELFWGFDCNLHRRSTFSKFDLTGVRALDLQIMTATSTFHAPSSATPPGMAHDSRALHDWYTMSHICKQHYARLSVLVSMRFKEWNYPFTQESPDSHMRQYVINMYRFSS